MITSYVPTAKAAGLLYTHNNFQMENFLIKSDASNFENNIFENKAGIQLTVIVTQLFWNFLVENAPQFSFS